MSGKFIVWIREPGQSWEPNGEGPLTQKQADRIAKETRAMGVKVVVLSEGQTPSGPGADRESDMLEMAELRKRHEEGAQARRRKQADEQIAAMVAKGPLPPDPEEQNEDRAKWAEAALMEFIRQTGADAEDAVSDLCADLMHWCDRHGLEFDVEAERGRMHYTAETTEGPDPTPIGNEQVIRETGAAGMRIELSKGEINVYHVEGGKLLLNRVVEAGFWCERLWPLLRGEA